MRFLAHRGLWHDPSQRNRPEALRQALARGFGVETDLRDAGDALVIAHDPAEGGAASVDDFFAIYREFGGEPPLALNIKADGLRSMLEPLLARHAIRNYFCFDMSVPETLNYWREGLRFFTRESEYEPAPALYAEAHGVWMDMFREDWVTPAHIGKHLAAGKEVALVSPELHRRPHLGWWEKLRSGGLARAQGLMLCTDFPEAASEFFDADD